MSNSKITGRARRKEHLAGLNRNSSLNLVSLMDIFTILVFFLLVSSGSQQLPTSKDITLPTSNAQKVPKETLVISITQTDILVQGAPIAKISDVIASSEILIKELIKELEFRRDSLSVTPKAVEEGYAVTIMGDEDIPYLLLRKILATCRQTNYVKIAFAANQIAKDKG